jgi:hypothetical protein
MKIAVSTFASERRERDRLYTISLTPRETLDIVDAPAGVFLREPQTQAQFQILPHHLEIPKESVAFRYIGDCYTFLSQTGFQTDEEHLDWLTGLGKIPMIGDMEIRGEAQEIPLGYVEFQCDAH